MPTTRSRLVVSNQIVFDQADYFQADGFTRILGLGPTDVQLEMFFNNALLGWVLVDGTSIPDPQVTSGRIYFQAIGTGPYGIRWRPNANGFWRLVLTLPTQSTAPAQVLAQEYDVSPAGGVVSSGEGLHTSFIRPGDQSE